MRRSMESHFGIRLDSTFAEPRRGAAVRAVPRELEALPRARAREMAAEFSISPVELHLVSRGFKQYRNAPRVSLPSPAKSGTPCSRALRERRSRRELTSPLALDDLATLLVESFEPTSILLQRGCRRLPAVSPLAVGGRPLSARRVRRSGERRRPRAWPLPPQRAHERARTAPSRPPREILDEGFFADFVVSTAAVLVFAAVFDRTIAKYGERGYRLVLLDAGHAAQNALLDAERLACRPSRSAVSTRRRSRSGYRPRRPRRSRRPLRRARRTP